MKVIRTTTIRVSMPLPILLNYMRKGGAYLPDNDGIVLEAGSYNDDIGHQVIHISWREME